MRETQGGKVIMKFDPYDGSVDPCTGVFTLAPMTDDKNTLDPISTYIVPGQVDPATRFPRRNVATKAGTYKWDFSLWDAKTGGWAKILKSIDPKGYNYLWNLSDGVRFGSNIRSVVFPQNQIKFSKAQFIRAVGMVAQWYGVVDYYDFNKPPAKFDIATAPSYLLQNQTDMDSLGNVYTSMFEVGFNVYLPLVSKVKIYAPYTWVVYPQ